jgi:O-antigen/teichoic acid export membrane protein
MTRRMRWDVLMASLVSIAIKVAGGLAGIVIARSVGPATRGEYAAVMAWYAVVISIGGMGQSAAAVYRIARDRERAAAYVASARAIMTGAGLVLVPLAAIIAVVASGDEHLRLGYLLMLGTCLWCFVSGGYTVGLQVVDLAQANAVRLAQPLAYLLFIVVLGAAGELNLTTVLVTFWLSTVVSAVMGRVTSSRHGLTGGRTGRREVRELLRYGLAQLAGSLPTLLVGRLDQLVLSVTASAAALGHYAVAASLISVVSPFAAGPGFVVFPRIAARGLSVAGTRRLARQAVLLSLGVGVAVMACLVLAAPWLLPVLLGPGYEESVGLVALLAPAGVFLAAQQVCCDLLRGQGRPMTVARMQAAAAAALALALVVLVPLYGVQGAAVASSLASAVAMVLMLAAVFRGDDRTVREPAPVAASTP